MSRIVENLIDLHWDIILVQNLELWEVLLIADPPVNYQVGMEITSLRAIDWVHHW